MDDGVASRSRTLEATTPRVLRAWYVVAWSGEVRGGLVKRRLHGRPLVLWRTSAGLVRALEDRCPHRAVPLSFGAREGDHVRCGYHGWTFDGDGRCVAVPGMPETGELPARGARPFPVIERQGCVWVWGDPEVEPDVEPFHFRHAEDPRYVTVRKVLPANGSVHAVIENALDVPHTSFLHGGLFRTDRGRRPIRCVIRRHHDRVECEFLGEELPKGLAARLLAPSGGRIEHVDRFLLPSITEVEYRLGEDNHVVLNGACTPVDDLETWVYAVVQVRTRLPKVLVRPLVEPIALRIFQQDAVVLSLQTETLKTFAEATFTSTDLDVLGSHILRLLTRAARGEAGDPAAPPVVRETTMLV